MRLMAQVCVYIVSYVPAGCTEYKLGDTVEGPCNGPCQDLVIGDGPCEGAYLTALSCSCEESGGG
jgi:hypothetical protein